MAAAIAAVSHADVTVPGLSLPERLRVAVTQGNVDDAVQLIDNGILLGPDKVSTIDDIGNNTSTCLRPNKGLGMELRMT